MDLGQPIRRHEIEEPAVPYEGEEVTPEYEPEREAEPITVTPEKESE